MKPTHKAEIVQLYEQGLDEAEIAYRSHHAQSSVGRYLRDYERVKLALQRQIPVEQIPTLIDMQPAVVRAYVNLVAKYHPDLLSISELTPIGS
jgi:protoheme ferro-lyase